MQPLTKEVTSGVIRPGGEKLSKNAVPVTKDLTENRLQPAVEHVSPALLLNNGTLLHSVQAVPGLS